jgi:hypothetical protein
MSSDKARSKYASKQGRSAGGGRTRYAKTSPFHENYSVDRNHRLARAWLHGEKHAYPDPCCLPGDKWKSCEAG